MCPSDRAWTLAPTWNRHKAATLTARCSGESGRFPPKIDSQITFDHDECLIGVLMVVPNEVTLHFHDLELIIIHFGDDLRSPVLLEQSEFLLEIDCLIAHKNPSIRALLFSIPASRQCLKRL